MPQRTSLRGAPRAGEAIGGSSVLPVARIGIAVVLIFTMFSAPLYAAKKAEDPNLPRNLAGTVFDQERHPVPGAVVYLKNMRNLAVITYITGEDGSYRFNNLSPDVDYEVRAEHNDHKSQTRALSSFDAHKEPHIDLRLGK
jgi:protocatechuate 3,4-dioxygenase beta subunit